MSIEQDVQEIRRHLDQDRNTVVSVALFGQPGAGKSSLINKIVGQNVAAVGVETDKTVEAARYQANGLEFVDLPGYGTKGFPKESYFEDFRINSFDLFLCVTSGKLHQADTEFFQELLRLGKACVFVVNKHDELWEDGVSIEELEQRKRQDILKHVGMQAPIIFTSCRHGTGMDALNTEIMKNLESAKRERWTRGAQAYSVAFLEEKKEACEKYVSVAAAAAAANAINPVPGVDVAVDLSILIKLFGEIRDYYGLSDDFLAKLKQSSVPMVGQLANNVVKYAAKEGLLVLLKRFAGRQATKTLAKYVPFVGQALAASIGYAITSSAGTSYLEDCHKLAEEILLKKLSA
ncbi:GTPase [Pseudomonas sp.]|uniref:GTPase n=1 Tax=Pseudomonas sp. TaxID=306 RepID=UPI0028AB1E78|nr:GTPase [Pseudomonas sp.]